MYKRYGRTLDRTFRTEELNRLAKELREEKSRLDRLPLRQKEAAALSFVTLEVRDTS